MKEQTKKKINDFLNGLEEKVKIGKIEVQKKHLYFAGIIIGGYVLLQVGLGISMQFNRSDKKVKKANDAYNQIMEQQKKKFDEAVKKESGPKFEDMKEKLNSHTNEELKAEIKKSTGQEVSDEAINELRKQVNAQDNAKFQNNLDAIDKIQQQQLDEQEKAEDKRIQEKFKNK